MKTYREIFFVTCLLLFIGISNASAATIITNFIGGAAPANASGGGNLSDIVNTAARLWESAYSDPIIITIHYGWAPAGDAGTHTLLAQGDNPNRELSGMILFDNGGEVSFYLDPTPGSNDEYLRRTEEQLNLGGGYVNVARLFSHPTGDAVGHVDLLSVALHEMGHAMGMCAANTSFVAKSRRGIISITGSLPYIGTVIPLAYNNAGVVAHFDSNAVVYGSLMSGVNSDERRIPSELDILANAQISGLKILNLYPKILPQPDVIQATRSAPVARSLLPRQVKFRSGRLWTD